MIFTLTEQTTLLQDTRLLLVISNFGHLSKAVIPSMLTQLETAFGVTLAEDRKVRNTVSSECRPCDWTDASHTCIL